MMVKYPWAEKTALQELMQISCLSPSLHGGSATSSIYFSSRKN
ncbi:hypothetical protein [Treponema sp.]